MVQSWICNLLSGFFVENQVNFSLSILRFSVLPLADNFSAMGFCIYTTLRLNLGSHLDKLPNEQKRVCDLRTERTAAIKPWFFVCLLLIYINTWSVNTDSNVKLCYWIPRVNPEGSSVVLILLKMIKINRHKISKIE